MKIRKSNVVERINPIKLKKPCFCIPSLWSNNIKNIYVIMIINKWILLYFIFIIKKREILTKILEINVNIANE